MAASEALPAHSWALPMLPMLPWGMLELQDDMGRGSLGSVHCATLRSGPGSSPQVHTIV